MTDYKVGAPDLARFVDAYNAVVVGGVMPVHARLAGLQAVVDHVLAGLPTPATAELVAFDVPTMEYAEVHGFGAVLARASEGWRVHTAQLIAAGGDIGRYYLLERPAPDGAEATLSPHA